MTTDNPNVEYATLYLCNGRRDPVLRYDGPTLRDQA